MKTLAALCLALTGCVKWNGAYLGVQHVTPVTRTVQGRVQDNGSGYLNLIWTAGRWSFQVEPIFPFSGSEPLLRLACDYKIF